MPAPQRKSLLASRRRRRQDEGEEEESVLGDFEDDSLSEGSAVSNGDDEAEFEGSESSGDEREPAVNTMATAKSTSPQKQQASSVSPVNDEATVNGNGFRPSAEMEAMRNGLTQAHHSPNTEQLQFDDLPASNDAANAPAEDALAKAPRNENPAQRARREHQEYIRQRNANPAFVPTRGGFFLHDDRNSHSTAPNPRPFGRGRGRNHGPPNNNHNSRPPTFNEPTDKPWAHDLHDEHESPAKSEPPQTKPGPILSEASKSLTKVANTSTPPNRTFSFTTVLGNVNVQVSLPGMAGKVAVPNVVKKHHTLLPQHRPPLRRDKPVRVSIPETAPRYIFPSVDRSFIFIPRALRPNQQNYTRGRGRGSFGQSRRLSGFTGYTPSVAMSRKSSMGASTMRDAIRSPTDSVMSRQLAGGRDSVRPVVRLPSAGSTPGFNTGMLGVNGHPPMGNMPMPLGPMYGVHSTAIPMHQPRPQKTVSVADIESPASFQFKAPQQQQELPFHQQVPSHMAQQYGDDKSAAQPTQANTSGIAGAAPLSQIPEGAVFAPGFQPYPIMNGPAYFGAPYSNGAVFYPPVHDGSSFGVPMVGPALAPSFVPGSQSHPVNYVPPSPSVGSGMAGNMMAHESHGMVYYYNPTMYAPEGQSGMQQFPMAPNGNMMPMPNGVPGQPPYYYPPVPAAMFYPAQSG